MRMNEDAHFFHIFRFSFLLSVLIAAFLVLKYAHSVPAYNYCVWHDAGYRHMKIYAFVKLATRQLPELWR